MKFFIGPVTKNTIDTVIKYSCDYDTEFVFIPSRRQIEYNGGYVNNFTTKEFVDYVKSKNNKIIIERDHSGPGQGKCMDDGFESLKEDCKYLDIIHIDPWKKYPKFEDAVEWNVKLINYCYELNPMIYYEIGTEEGIRPIESEELDKFVEEVKNKLIPEVYSQIKYLVIQCGTKLLEQSNIGTYNADKLKRMIEVCKKYNLIAKEHNGDWISYDIVQKKEKEGLTCINIAPEFGEIESSVILNTFKENNIQDVEDFFQICYESNTWKKWVSSDFKPEENKEKLIKICGHYNFTDPRFLKIKEKYSNIDNDICKAIKYRLMELLGIYTIRTHCIICNSALSLPLFTKDFETPCSFTLFDTVQQSIAIPYNIFCCNICKTVQTKYLGNLQIIYGNNHVDSFGQTKSNMNINFSKFVLQNNDIKGIIEIGACNDSLAELIINNYDTSYTIIEADYKGTYNKSINVIDSFVENVDFNTFNDNTLVLSHIFEHLYSPISFLEKISNSHIKYIYFNHPDFEYYCNNNVYNILNIEHIYYFEKYMLINLLKKYNFILDNEVNYENHSMFLKFIRTNDINSDYEIVNKYSIKDTTNYFNLLHSRINKLNELISDNTKKFYIWPASAHTVALFVNGLHYNKLDGLLDNSPNKIGKILYNYNLKCYSLDTILQNKDNNTYCILGGGGNYLNEIATNNDNIIIFNNL